MLNRHVVQVASYLRYGFPPEDALSVVGIDARFSATCRKYDALRAKVAEMVKARSRALLAPAPDRRQVLDEAGDWNIQRLAAGLRDNDPGEPCTHVPEA